MLFSSSVALGLLTCIATITVICNSAAFGEMTVVKTLNGQAIEAYTDYHALVIGVEQYDHWPDKSHAVEDAGDISWELQRLGFSVTDLADPTAAQLQAALAQLVNVDGQKRAQGVVVYYCGHSRTLESPDGQRVGWLIPKDAPRPDQNLSGFMEKAIGSDRIAAMADRIQSRQLLFLFDAPFSADQFQKEAFLMKAVTENSMAAARQFISAGAPQVGITADLVKGLQGEADLISDGMTGACELGLFLLNRLGQRIPKKSVLNWGRVTVNSDRHGDFIFFKPRTPPPVARLFVDLRPAFAQVQVLSIKPKFKQGIVLKPGNYDLKVSASGYQTVTRKIRLAEGEEKRELIRLPEEPPQIRRPLGMRFIRIGRGKFMMGSPAYEAGRSNDERYHPVELTKRFYLQSTEVTVDQFRSFVESTGYRTDAEKKGWCYKSDNGGLRREPGMSWQHSDRDLPVRCVSWNDADAFARWLSRQDEQHTYALPTEAQWEYAARAGTKTPFATGKCLSSDEANYAGVGREYELCTTVFTLNRRRPVPTGNLTPNPWRLYNMHGNVAEWCRDWYAPYPTDNAIDPNGPEEGRKRVIRGGHWQAPVAECRSAERRSSPPDYAFDIVGFRLVMRP